MGQSKKYTVRQHIGPAFEKCNLGYTHRIGAWF